MAAKLTDVLAIPIGLAAGALALKLVVGAGGSLGVLPSMSLVDVLSSKIRARLSYGTRLVKVKKRGCYLLRWSNSGRDWYPARIHHAAIREGGPHLQYEVDANEIMVCDTTKKEIQAVAEYLTEHGPELPLYGRSTEARVRSGKLKFS